MRFSRSLNVTLGVLLTLVLALACSTSSETADPARQSGGQLPATGKTTTPVPRPACAPDATGDHLVVRDLRADDACFISPLSLQKVGEQRYMIGLNCPVAPTQGAGYSATVKRVSDGYSVELTPDDSKRIPDKLDCGGTGDSVYVSVTIRY